jgi:hypothetical protein
LAKFDLSPPGWTRSTAVCFTAIEHDLAAHESSKQALPRLFLFGLLFGLFSFSFGIFSSHSSFGVWPSGPALRLSERRTFSFGCLFGGTAPRLSGQRTYFFGPLAFPSSPQGHAEFFGISGGAAIFALSCFPVIHMSYSHEFLHSFHQASIIKAGTFLSIHFSILI